MYLRAVHAEGQLPVLQQFIRDNPLGILTTAIKSPIYSFIQSSHIPFVLDVLPSIGADDTIPPGILRGHMAKQNPQAKVLIEALAGQNAAGDNKLELTDEVLILFNGPHHHYVTPNSTQRPNRHLAYGKISVYCNSKAEETGAFLQKQIQDLSQQSETGIMGYTGGDKKSAWNVSDAPVNYVELLKKNIIGIEIRVERLQGKFKMSQEMGEGDREGVVQGFEELGSEIGKGIADCVRERAALKEQQKSA
ncbi:hypothetical protein PENNAL_c0053G11866 [Penicillium nalgiovense]|uniref:Uncharacterized protein n=1 Tax=Penicillium nalgiovense TaxID=60175 RepID=A0A1V6XVN3_PENNA|nr:hypothetical protein PENNAL_c0053G11866 [Penicillium nalgiovense]